MQIDPALAKLTNIMGAARATAVIAETLRDIGLAKLETPDDRMRFAISLMRKGGLLEAIGRAIKIQAILHGAKDQ